MAALMSRQSRFKLIHFVSALWFVLSAGFLLALTLRQAGKSWWVIVSLSGYSTVTAFLVISLYLFAIFRGVTRSQKTKTEHPLTTSVYYSVFYDISPFLGALAGSVSAIGVDKTVDYLSITATGSLWATFLVWIVLDPAAGLIEMLPQSSRGLRRKRLAELKNIREKELLENQQLLARIEAEEQKQQEHRRQILRPCAEKLAILSEGGENNEAEVVDIGVNAWQKGGLNYMRQLHSMVTDIWRQKYPGAAIIDYVSIWWDGIGGWQSQWLEGEVG